MKRNPWFTEADQAEIDLVAMALVDCAFTHREHCSRCRELGRFCPPLAGAFGAAVRWAETRALASKAEALRRRHVSEALATLERRAAA
jgi:hypothetical protein